MNTMLRRKLFVVVSMNCKLFLIHPFHFRNVFSTEAHSQTLFSQFASTKLNMSEADISRIFKSQPRLQNLRTRTIHKVEKIIHSFKMEGFTEVQIAKLLTRYPYILHQSLENNILPTMEFLKNVFRPENVFIKALVQVPRLLSCSLEKTLKPSLAFWEGHGFSGTELVSFLQAYPLLLIRTSLIPAQVDLINKLGAVKGSKNYKYILAKVAMSRTETLEAKIENLKLCGLSAEEICQLLGVSHIFLCLSKENVREKMNFLVNNMELPVHSVVKHPSLLRISLEKTIRPRFLVWQKIKSINASELPLLTVLTMTEKRFVNRIIKEHPESKILWTIYENAISNASNRTKSSTKQNLE